MDTDAGTGMSRGKQWIVLGLVAALAVGIGGWTLLVSPKRAEAALVREQAAMQTAANQRSETHLEVLRSKQAEVPEREAYLEQVKTRIPGEEGMPDLLRSLSSAAATAGVELVSVVPGSATVVAAPGSAAAPVAGTGAAPAPAAPTTPAPPTAVPPTSDGLLAVPLTLEVVGGFYDIEQFVAHLEELPRALRLTEVSLVDGGDAAAGASGPVDGRSLKTTLTGLVFVHGSPSPDAGTTTAAGGPTGTAAVAGPSAETTS
jgi:Tfp pilus assembly protein PilO